MSDDAEKAAEDWLEPRGYLNTNRYDQKEQLLWRSVWIAGHASRDPEVAALKAEIERLKTDAEIAFLATATQIETHDWSYCDSHTVQFTWADGTHMEFVRAFKIPAERDEFYNRVMEARGK